MRFPFTTDASNASAGDAVRDAPGDVTAPCEDVVDPWIDHRHRVLHRARRVSTLMLELWGDEPPPTSDPALTAAEDAVAADDGVGRAAHVVVQGDHLTYRQLGDVLALVKDVDDLAWALSVLPVRLRHRLADTGCLGERTDARRSTCDVDARHPDR